MSRFHAFLAIFLLMVLTVVANAQAPSLFMTPADFKTRLQLAKREPWAQRSLGLLLKEADDFPTAYTKRFGTPDAAPPPEGGQWLHWYACPGSGRPLKFYPPDQNICPDDGKNFRGYPYDQVVYQIRNDALSEAAIAEALAFRFTGKTAYAHKAAGVLKSYTRVYPTYKLHDIRGNTGPNGGLAFAQTLDESIWLIKLAWTYDLLRDTGFLSADEQKSFEDKVLRPAEAVVVKAHKEPTDNIQSWINGAAAAVGFTLGDKAMISEAIDGPIGFRHQMKAFVHEGFWAEGAWGYQFYAMRALTMTAQMATRKGIDLWKQEPNLLALFHSPLGVVLPDGSLPGFNDSGSPSLYDFSFLYEVAYADTHDATLLPILEHGARGNREAFLFGTQRLPATPAPRLASAVFPEAGYATLRSPSNDLTVITKFGPHGGGHGHYDKLNFILYANGITLAEDPGTNFYGLPIHREWDSMTIAHNTISVDQQRQAQVTGKLLDWHVGDNWTAVRADAGPAYVTADLQRTILLTPGYVLLVDRCESKDGKPHTFDWAYHNVGSQLVTSPVALQPYSFSAGNGYEHLSNVKHGTTSEAIALYFAADRKPQTSAGESNSTPATYNSAPVERSKKTAHADLTLQMQPSSASQIFTGGAPSRNFPTPVPVVIVRRSGTSATFVTLLTTSTLAMPASPAVHIRQTGEGTFEIESDGSVDRFSDVKGLTLEHHAH